MTLGQENWPWARGRLTAGFVLDLRSGPAVGNQSTNALVTAADLIAVRDHPRGLGNRTDLDDTLADLLAVDWR